MVSRKRNLIFLILISLQLIAVAPNDINADVLPPESDRVPVPIAHFPDTLHAVVWRNWGLVDPERLAKVLDTSPDRITELAESMGLPPHPQLSLEMPRRGYLTLIRRNWHLLPYEQLVELLGINREQLAFLLREDDVLYIKLGSLKPKCEPVRYQTPSPETRRRTADIKQLVRQYFGDQKNLPTESRFAFIKALSEVDDASTTSPAVAPLNAPGPRFIYSYFALFGDPLSKPELDPYPDGLLQRLQARGVNGIWLHVVLRQLAPGGQHFSEWGDGHELRLDNLRKLVERGKKFGIDVYLYMNEPRAMPTAFFRDRPDMAGVTEDDHTALCTSSPQVRQWVSDSLAHVFREVPGLGGIFTITASENLTNCASHGQHADCPRCKHRSRADILAEINTAMAEGVHRASPDAKVIVWDWGWQPWLRSSERNKSIDQSQQAQAKGDIASIVPQLPPGTWMMSVSEWALPIERGGVPSRVGEYTISAVGPGPRATAVWNLAKQHRMKSVAKVQLNATWELSSVPYLPVFDLVAEHCARLSKAEIDGMMLSWSVGGYPSPNLELAQQFSRRPAPDVETALQALAERHFGAEAAPKVRAAWTKFSRAFAEFPLNIQVVYRGPQQLGPANLLYAEPTKYEAGVVVSPYDDLKSWCGPYSSQILAQQFQKIAEGWSHGLIDLAAAQPLVSQQLKQAASADFRVATAAQLHFASAANQIKFIIARDKLLATDHLVEQRPLRAQIAALLESEIDLAKRLHALSHADSRLGYEASNQYYYVPQDLIEKVLNCVELQDHFMKGG